MAEINPPAFLQNAGATHTAEITREIVNALTGGGQAGTQRARGGVHPSLGLKLAVTQAASPNMTVDVSSGHALVPGTENIKQGLYSCFNDATKNVSIAASDPSLPRIDIIVAKVQDSFYSGATNSWSIVAVTGTAAGSPAVPTAPANALILAQIAVGAGVTSIVNANITDRRFYLTAVGGITPVASQTERDALSGQYSGLPVWRTDRESFEVKGASAWNEFRAPKIAENILVGATGTVTFSSIPTTFRHLQLWVAARGDAVAGFVEMRLRFNGDTGANYDAEMIAGNAGTAAAAESIAATSMQVGEFAGSTAAAGSCGIYVINIPWYGSTVFHKMVSTSHGLTIGTATTAVHSKHWAGRWRSTAAINSVSVIALSGNFIVGSSFALYGMP